MRRDQFDHDKFKKIIVLLEILSRKRLKSTFYLVHVKNRSTFMSRLYGKKECFLETISIELKVILAGISISI